MENFPYEQRFATVLSKYQSDNAIFVGKMENIFYLTGFWGTAGFLIIHNNTKYLFVDSRYSEQAANTTYQTQVILAAPTYFGALISFLKKENVRALDIEKDDLSYQEYESISNMLSENAIGFSIIESEITKARISKDKQEIKIIKENLLLTEKVLVKLLACLKEGISELDLARELYYLILLEGGQKTSFDSIILFGERSSLPHGMPSDRKLKFGDNILMDFGLVKDGYRTDISRTFFFGRGTQFEAMSAAYKAVKEANITATQNATTSRTCAEVDKIARDVLAKYELDKYFRHSLGHGVGLEIHEAPSLGQTSKSVLQSASIITIEPGIYIENQFGIRLENMILVTANNPVVLNTSTLDLIVL